MTDPTPRLDDELVSAVLDGEATADDRARVEADPAARARLAELRAVRDLVAAPVSVPAAARESAVAAALARFDAAIVPGAPASSDPAAVTPASADRGPDPAATPNDELARRRARRSSNGGRFLAAAAAVVVVVLGAAAVLRVLNPPADVDMASSPTAEVSEPQAVADASGGASETPTNKSAGGPVTSTTSAPDQVAPVTTIAPLTSAPTLDALGSATVVTVDLGDLTTPRELRDRMLAIVDARTADSSSGAPAPTTVPAPGSDSGSFADLSAFANCASYLDAVDPELDQLLAVGAATYEGRPATIFAFSVDQAAHPAANGSVRIYAVDPTTCATLSVLTTR